MSLYILIDILGWVGTILYLVAYALVSMKRVDGDSVVYQGMNITAGALLVIHALCLRAYPSAGLNVAWIGIGMLTLGRRWLTRS